MAPNQNRSTSGNKSDQTIRNENLGSKRKKNQPGAPDKGKPKGKDMGEGPIGKSQTKRNPNSI